MVPLKPLPMQSSRNQSPEEDEDLEVYLMEVADMGIPLSNSCDQPRTPESQALGVPSSAIPYGSSPAENVFSSASTTSTAPTIYEDLEDQYSIVKDVAFENPFAPRKVRVVLDDDDLELDDYSPNDDIDMIVEDRPMSETHQQDEHGYHNSSTDNYQTSDSDSEFSFVDEGQDGLDVQERTNHPRLNFSGKNTIFVGEPKVFTEVAEEHDELLSDEDNDGHEADEDMDGESVDVAADTAMTDSDRDEGLTARRPSASDSVWDNYEAISQQLQEYDTTKQTIKGHESWTEDQAKLHKLLTLRGVWPMFERTWTFHFKDREIYPWVYAPEDTTKKVAITAKSNDFRGESLFRSSIPSQLLIPSSSCQSSRIPV